MHAYTITKAYNHRKCSVMKFKNPYWSNKLKISSLQRWIIVHSILYYELNDSIIEDKQFDDNARQLVKLQKEHPSDAKCSDYWYVFHDFDASTGFYIYSRLNKHDKKYLTSIAQFVSKQSKRSVKSEIKRK